MDDESHTPTRRSVLRGLGAAGGIALGAASVSGTAAASSPTHCPKTPGYWRTHYPDGWPRYVDGDRAGELGRITVAGVTYADTDDLVGHGEFRDLRDLVGILWAPPMGDKALIMAHHLIAAKLNRWSAPPGTTCSAIERLLPYGKTSVADAWLEQHPIGSDVRHWGTFEYGGETYDVEHVKDVLVDYNEGRLCECDDGDYDGSSGPAEPPRRGPPER